MKSVKNEFPNPVLALGRDDYIDSCQFFTAFESENVRVTADNIVIPIAYTLICKGLKNLVEAEKAIVIISVKSSAASFSKLYRFPTNSTSMELHIPKYNVVKRIEVTGYIIAAAPINQFRCDGEFNDLYFSDSTFEIRKGDILARENSRIIYIDDSELEKPKYPVAISNVSSVKRKRKYTCDEQADLDIKTSNNLIGDIINLSQELNTRIWDKVNRGGSYEDIKEIYLDVCILNVASNLEIDSAKKEFNINNSKELMRLREKYRIDDDDGRCIKPNFFKAKDIGKGYYDNKKRNYKKHLTTMDFLQECVNSYRSQRKGKAAHNTYLPFSELIDDSDVVKRSRSVKVERVLNIINDMSNEIKSIYASDIEPATKAILGNDARQRCVEYVGSMSFSKSDMVYLLKQIEQPQYSKIHKKILEILFGYPNTSFYEVLKQNQASVGYLVPESEGDIFIYDGRYYLAYTPIWS